MGGMAENDQVEEYAKACIEYDELKAEIARLKSAVSWQETTITARDARIAELIGERDSLMDQCHGLQRLADERDGLRMRVATLEKHLSGVVNMITDDSGTFTANFNEEFRGRIRDSRKYLKTEKARAALEKKEVAP